MKLKTLLPLLKEVWKQEKSMVLALILCSIAKALPTYTQVLFTALLLDALSNSNINYFIWLVFGMLSINCCFKMLSHVTYQYFLARKSSFSLTYDMKIIQKNSEIDFDLLESHHTQQMLQEAREGMMYSGGISVMLEEIMNMVSSMTTILLSLFTMISLQTSWTFRLLVLVLMSFLFMIHTFFLTKSYRINIVHRQDLLRINQEFNYYTCLPDDRILGKNVRIYNMADMLEEKINAYFKRSLDNTSTFNKVIAKLLGLDQLFGQWIVGMMYILMFIYVVMQQFTLGYVATYVGLITQIHNAFQNMAMYYAGITEKSQYMKAYQSYLELSCRPCGRRQIDDKIKEHHLTFEHVSFHYPNSDHFILNDLNLTLSFNERTALVGLNGAGKTTIVKLICRFYEPTSGQILLDGFPLRDYDFDAYIKKIGAVFQDFQFLSLPIDENLCYPHSPNQNRLNSILNSVDILSKIQQLAYHEKTYLGKEVKDGVILSGGQMQKLAICRALYKDSDYLILDEPTAALDPVSEAEIYADFNQMSSNRGALFISHRLSSCRFCHQIYVLKDGKVIENGTHESLIKENGEYASLWYLQASQYHKIKKKF